MRIHFICLVLLSFAFVVSAQKHQVDVGLIKTTVQQWSEAHNTKDRRVFEKLYAPTLLFYTKELSQNECIQIKLNRLNLEKVFSQKTVSSLANTFYKSGIIKCEFTKEVTTDKNVTEIKSYLLLELKENTYQIVGESDILTDKRLNYQLLLEDQYKINELELVDFPTFSFNSKTLSIIKWLIPTTAVLAVLLVGYYKLSRYRRKNRALKGSKKYVDKVVTYKKSQEETGKSNEIKKKKGDEFEAFVFERFDRNYFKIRYWNGDLFHKGLYPESNTYPDLEIEYTYQDYKRVFAIECKFRSNPLNTTIKLERRQLDNYEKYAREKSIRVYIALGLFGKPTNPKRLYLIPLENFATRDSLSFEEIAKFERGTNFFHYDRKLDMLK